MPRKRSRMQFEYDTLDTIQHIDISNNNLLEAAIKASLDGAGLEEAKEESRIVAAADLFAQVMEQLPGLTKVARRTLLLIVGLDDIISNERNRGVNPLNLLALQQKLQEALDKGDPADSDSVESALAFIEGYDIDAIKNAVYPRLQPELDILAIKDAEDEEAEAKEIDEAIMASIALASTLEEGADDSKIELAEEKADKPLTREELRAARLAFLDKSKTSS